MPELMAHDVGALAGKDRASGGRTMEELQPLAVIKRVEVDTEIEVHGQDRAHFPPYPRHQCPPQMRRGPLRGALGWLLGLGISPWLHRRRATIGEASSPWWRPCHYPPFTGHAEVR